MIANTTVSVHTITRLVATNPRSYGAPLVLTCERGRGDSTEITLFLDDHELVERLVKVINATIDGASPKAAACPQEAAAYEAELHAYKWSGL
jgi:hypothetical protein